jgi:hypothetical protein
LIEKKGYFRKLALIEKNDAREHITRPTSIIYAYDVSIEGNRTT